MGHPFPAQALGPESNHQNSWEKAGVGVLGVGDGGGVYSGCGGAGDRRQGIPRVWWAGGRRQGDPLGVVVLEVRDRGIPLSMVG